jgi:hypothetical protein
MPTLTIRDETSAGRLIGRFDIPVGPSRLTLGQLIRTRVREEVARYNVEKGNVFQGLVRPIDAEDVRDGYRLAQPRSLNWEDLAGVALASFERSGYAVVIDGHRVSDLATTIDVAAEPDVAFLRPETHVVVAEERRSPLQVAGALRRE